MTVCAWCEPPTDETPEDTSHGICEEHAEEMLLNYQWNRLQNTPSYVEQNAAEFAAEEE